MTYNPIHSTTLDNFFELEIILVLIKNQLAMNSLLTFTIFSFLFFGACQNPKSNQKIEDQTATAREASTEYFLKNFEGKIGDFPVFMTLTNWGDGFLTGKYYYKKTGKWIALSGEMIGESTFEIMEYVEENETGKLTGKISSPEIISGVWSSPDESKMYNFELLAQDISLDDNWSGNWFLNEIWDNGLLLMGNKRKDTIDFALSIFRSGHNGIAEGSALISGNKASYFSKEFDEEEGCSLTFELLDDHILLTQEGSNFACGFGMRAFAGGKYDNQEIEKKAKLSVGTNPENVFQTETQHDNFKAFVGEEMYDLFAFNFQHVDVLEQNAKDGFNAICKSGFVQGFFSFNEAIIMCDDSGKFWAATIDVETSTDEFLVRYFTNDEERNMKLPETINDWRENFVEYKVEYGKALQ